jgi:DNA-binding response OmpR family regulator
MILLVTKNINLGRSFQKDLNQEGFKVSLIKEHDKVIQFLLKNPDHQMLTLDLESLDDKTTEIIGKLKKYPELQYIPVICIIKKEMLVKQLMAFELGADEFIFSPYTTTELQLKIRSIHRLLDLQNQLLEKESLLNSLRQTQSILVTLSHYINNSLTPLYSMVQVMDKNNPDDAERLMKFSRRTVDFIKKVLLTLNNLIQSGELKVVQEGIYKNLMLDIEKELKNLQKK